MMGGRGVVGSPMEYTKIDQNGYSSITKQIYIKFILQLGIIEMVNFNSCQKFPIEINHFNSSKLLKSIISIVKMG